MNNLEEIRKEINKIDKSLVELFEKRMNIVYQVAENKSQTKKAIYDSKREEEVIKKAMENTKNNELIPYTKQYFEALMDISKQYQKNVIHQKNEASKTLRVCGQSVGFQGVFGSFSDNAVDHLYDEKIIRKNYDSFEELFIAVSNEEVDEGVLPYENTSTGGVNDVLDLLLKYDLYIVSQIDIKINHCLLGIKGSTVEELLFVYSHQQALSQCHQFFKENPHILAYPYANTAMAAKDVSIWHEESKGAIGSKKAAKLYNLEIIKENIQDHQLNTTRFIVVKKKLEVAAKANKTSIIFASLHVPGALYQILKSFYDHDINITKIESRPNLKKKFEYYFYVDFEGNLNEAHVKKALSEIKNHCQFFKLLGSYTARGEIT